MESDITRSFRSIYVTMSDKVKRTAFARAVGYSSTAQLEATLSGKAQISTKAIVGLVNNLKVNPVYLLTGNGDMFLMDETDIDKLKKENCELARMLEEANKTIQEQDEAIKKLEQRNIDLIELSSAAIKYLKGDIKETEK
jgi:hypothetical protein